MEQMVFDKAATPVQPGLLKQQEYCQCLVDWNPYARKSEALCYQFRTGAEGATVPLIPDACVDLLVRCEPDAPAAVVRGIQTGPRELILAPNSTYFGFKPYTTKGTRPMSAAWHELADREIPLRELLSDGDALAERLAGQSGFKARVDTAVDFARLYFIDGDYTPDFVELSEIHICAEQGRIRMDQLSDFTGYTSRYCRERFKEAHGVSIKNYSDILRFQNAVRMLSQPQRELADVVFDNGYFDQSHLNREFRRFAGDTPLRFRRNYCLAGYPA